MTGGCGGSGVEGISSRNLAIVDGDLQNTFFIAEIRLFTLGN